jgi:hypothetical protein
MNNENLTKISDKLDSMLFTCSYDFIILFSKGQIIVGKISSNITKLAILLGDKYIESRLECYIYSFFNIETRHITNKDINMFEFIKNGDVINRTVSLNNNLIDEDKYDFVVLSNESTNCKKIIQKKDVVNNANEIDTSIVLSNVKFMVFQLNIPFFSKYDNESLFDLQLSNAKYNFLLHNNRIDRDVLLFFINNYYYSKIVNIQHLNGCEVRLIDNYANILSVDLDKQYICIFENNYEVKDIVESDEIDESDESDESDEKEVSALMSIFSKHDKTFESCELPHVNIEKKTPDISSNNSSIESFNTDN